MKILITGVGGFVGSHLVELLRREQPEAEVFGLTRPHGSTGAGASLGVRMLEADLNDPQALEPVLDPEAPCARTCWAWCTCWTRSDGASFGPPSS
jgi:nucleoside-diphosphate-sugar epimerase